MSTGSCPALERLLLPNSTISVWNIDLGDAVMGVTRRRDGFRNNSDERSTWLWQFAAVCGDQVGREVQTNSAAVHPATMSFLAAQPENVAILSSQIPAFLQRVSVVFLRRLDLGQEDLAEMTLVSACRRHHGWRAGWFVLETAGVKQV